MLRNFLLLTLPCTTAVAAAQLDDTVTKLSINPAKVERTIDIPRLVGGNLALWYEPEDLDHRQTLASLKEWQPGILRMPGGSWSDEYFWNGNGVRKGDQFDPSKHRSGTWEIDYSDYAPGFRVSSVTGELSDYHGHSDVRSLHELIRKQGAETIVTVNLGTGTAEMAAEWVRWANIKQAYAVRYWEIGNELDGEWELGHFDRDGKAMTADTYAKRFLSYAKAMKAVDPTIRAGGPACSNDQLAFVETLIREAGDVLDFVTFHTYPVLGGKRSEAQRFAQAKDAAKAIARIRGWIRQYQPDRADEIEIGVTEWHKQVMETRSTVDLSSGLWSCLFVGVLAEAGADFANQWDLFSTTASGGHGLFGKPGKEGPRAAFHALTLWCRHMHSDWLSVDGTTPSLQAFATRDDNEVSVMLVNTSTDQRRRVSLDLAGTPASGRAQAFRFSAREYFWNPHRNYPEWSHPATETGVEFDSSGTIEVPPLCAMVIKLPLSGKASATPLAVKSGEAELQLILPDRAPADLPVEGFVVVREKASDRAWPGSIDSLKLELDGPASIDRHEIHPQQSIGSFLVTPSAPGLSTVRVTGAGLDATHRITWTPVIERSQTLWTFADEASLAGMKSTYTLALDHQVRPNQSVAAVRLEKSIAAPQNDLLLELSELPSSLPKERIGGISGLLGASSDLQCDDPRASVDVVVQSNLDHWIPLQSIPLKELVGTWKTLKIRISDPAVLEAMPELYSLRFVLKSKSPVTGRIYLDDLGFILRASDNP